MQTDKGARDGARSKEQNREKPDVPRKHCITLFGVGRADALESSLCSCSSRVKNDKRPDTSLVSPEDSGSMISIFLRAGGGVRGGSSRDESARGGLLRSAWC